MIKKERKGEAEKEINREKNLNRKKLRDQLYEIARS